MLVLDMKTGDILVPESRETATPAADGPAPMTAPEEPRLEERLQPYPQAPAAETEVPAAIRAACLARLLIRRC